MQYHIIKEKNNTNNLKINNMKSGDKVLVIATDEQLYAIGMNNEKINDNLRKYESTISEELIKGKFKDADGIEHNSFVLDNTFVIPKIYLRLTNEINEKNEKKSNILITANKNLKIHSSNETVVEKQGEEIEELEKIEDVNENEEEINED